MSDMGVTHDNFVKGNEVGLATLCIKKLQDTIDIGSINISCVISRLNRSELSAMAPGNCTIHRSREKMLYLL